MVSRKSAYVISPLMLTPGESASSRRCRPAVQADAVAPFMFSRRDAEAQRYTARPEFHGPARSQRRCGCLLIFRTPTRRQRRRALRRYGCLRDDITWGPT